MAPRVDRTGSAGAGSKDQAAAARFIGLLEAQLRKHFQETNGNNLNPYAPEIGHANGQAWCATFVSWMLKKGGADPKLLGPNGNGSAAVEGLASYYQSAGKLMRNNGSYRPQPGDAIFYGGSHIEIVQRVEGNKIFAIGGNTSDGVNGHWKDINDPSITHYGRTFGEKLPDAVKGTSTNLGPTSTTGSGFGASGGGSAGGAPVATGVAPTGSDRLEDPLIKRPSNAWLDDGVVTPYGMTLDDLLEQLKKKGIDAADFLKANPQFKGKNGKMKIPKGAKLTLPANALKGMGKADGAAGAADASPTGSSAAQDRGVELNPAQRQAPVPDGTPTVTSTAFPLRVQG